MEELQNDSDRTGGQCGSDGAGADCDGGGGPLPNCCSLKNINRGSFALPRADPEDACSVWEVLYGSRTGNARADHT